MKKRINGLILAAGMSSRMGEFKPLMPLRGKTLIENSIDSMLLAGVNRIVVVLGYRGEELASILQSRYLGDTIVLAYNRDYAVTEMLASVKIGLTVMPACDAFFLLPGDMPVVAKETYLAVYRAMLGRPPSITFPTLEGYRKHPPLIDSAYIGEIMAFEGQGGLRAFWKLQTDSIATVPVDDLGCWTDLDTFEQYVGCLNRYSCG
jgi:Uncharacterized MobA-related protein